MERIDAMEYLFVLRYGLRQDNKEENEPFIDAIGYALKDMRKMQLAKYYEEMQAGEMAQEEEEAE